MPKEIDVQADGAAAHHHAEPARCAQRRQRRSARRAWPVCGARLNEDRDGRAAVITGAGRAFSAGGDFNYLEELRRGRRPARQDDHARPRHRDRHGALPDSGDRRRQRPRGRPGLQPGRAERHRLHGRECVPRRPARAGRSGGRRRRPADLAPADQPPAGQGVRVDRRADPGARGRRARAGQPRRRRSAGRGDRVREEDPGPAAAGRRGTKRLLNIQLERR